MYLDRIKCEYCGQQNKIDSLECYKCGAPVGRDTKVEQPTCAAGTGTWKSAMFTAVNMLGGDSIEIKANLSTSCAIRVKAVQVLYDIL